MKTAQSKEPYVNHEINVAAGSILVTIAEEYKSTLYSEIKACFPDSWHFFGIVQVFVKKTLKCTDDRWIRIRRHFRS